MTQKKRKPALAGESEVVELREKDLDEILQDETHMIDDHGSVIFGNRIKKPIFLEGDPTRSI